MWEVRGERGYEKQWGVATIRSTPARAAARSISIDSDMSDEPSSIPGITCECMSINDFTPFH